MRARPLLSRAAVGVLTNGGYLYNIVLFDNVLRLR